MNIKGHIESGHYPVDGKGRALVPTEGGHTATIYATDHPDGGMVIIGTVWSAPGVPVCCTWKADGGRDTYAHNVPQLLPPTRRKVKVTQFAVMVFGHESPWLVRDTEAQARNDGQSRLAGSRWTVVPLTGEYEEPWPDEAGRSAR